MNTLDVAQLPPLRIKPGIPKYIALVEAITQAVAAGQISPGQKFPGEQQLAQIFPLSLGTIQRGLRELVTLGVLERRQGHGTYVRSNTRHGQMAHPFHCRFINDAGDGYLAVFPEILSRQEIPNDGALRGVLEGQELLEINRRFRIGDEFFLFSRFYCDAARIPALATQPIKTLESSNFKDVIFRTTALAITRTELFNSVCKPPTDVAEELHVNDATLCTRLRATGHLADGSVVYYTEIFFPPTERELHIISDARDEGLEQWV